MHITRQTGYLNGRARTRYKYPGNIDDSSPMRRLSDGLVHIIASMARQFHVGFDTLRIGTANTKGSATRSPFVYWLSAVIKAGQGASTRLRVI